MERDLEKVLISGEAITRRLDEMAQEIQRDFPRDPIVVVALMKGALVFAADLLRRLPRMLELECLSVASYHGGTRSSGRIEFLDRTLPDVRDRRVLLLDDILDSGRTLGAVSQKLVEQGAAEVRSAVLLAKQRTREHPIEANHVGFRIEDEFVVGYGLDYRGRYRNLPYIATLRQAVVKEAGGEAGPPDHRGGG